MRNHIEKDPRIIELLKQYGGNPNNIPTSILVKERLSVVLSHDQFYLLHTGKIGWNGSNIGGGQFAAAVSQNLKSSKDAKKDVKIDPKAEAESVLQEWEWSEKSKGFIRF